MGNVNLSFWDLILVAVTFISLVLVFFQNYKLRLIRHSANGIYSQLWDIVTENDYERITEVRQMKLLINQVRISCIGMNKSLGVPESTDRPYDYAIKSRRERYRQDVHWENTKKQLRTTPGKIPG